MSIWLLAAVVIQVVSILAIAVLWIRLLRPPKEDPRLSRGLQLLQSKITVLEDLSDRTENQVKQLVQILEEKASRLQNKMLQAQDTIRQIENSMHKSLSVAEIFQDKIPHEEIIERNQQTKYVTAAKMAHEGKTVDEIVKAVDLPRSEVEFITKVNRDQLTFDPNLLPEWAKVGANNQEHKYKHEIEAKMMEKVFHPQTPDLSSLQRIESEFKQTVRDVEQAERDELEKQKKIEDTAQAIKQSATQMTQSLVRKVQFPRIHVDRSKLPQTIKE